MWAAIVQGARDAAPEVGGLLAVAAVVALWTWRDLRRSGVR